MSSPIISVKALSKAYRIGSREPAPDTLVGALKASVRSPFRNLRNLRRLDTLSHDSDAEDVIWALQDVSLDVNEGEVVGIIGRNGAGKSTLLKILSRITEPTEGRVVIRGRVSSLLEVGTGFHPELTGRENIYMNGTLLGMRKVEIDRKFDEIVDFSGVAKFLDTPIKRYSSGMQVRLAFAVAAHLEPELLIIDEVLAVGDAEFQSKCLGKMRDVATGGRTVLFVSHNMAAVESLCNRGFMLDAGAVVRDGRIADVLAVYRQSWNRRASTPPKGDSDVNAITRVELITDGNQPQYLELGRPLVIEIDVCLAEAIFAPTVGIGIDNAWGQRILSLHTHRTHHLAASMSGQCRIRVTVPQCPLAPDEYTLRVVISSRNGHVATLDRALTFAVIDAEAFGEGRGFHRGYCVAPTTWEIVESVGAQES
jgi:lipopolysaccharide transport system ATP-binding protein